MNHASTTKLPDKPSANINSSGKKPFFSIPIQAKLAVNPSNDKYEREADRMAGQVVQKCAECEKEEKQPINSHITVQRKCAECEKKEELQRKENIPSVKQSHTSEALTSSIQSSRGKGTGMDNQTQSLMEGRFGMDFSSVHIHTGSEAAGMNRQLNAKAFTVGNDIYFNEGKYQPQSTEGKHLLAHELTHVVQQTGTIQKKPDPAPKSTPAPNLVPVKPTSSDIKDVRAFYSKVTGSPTVYQYFIVDGNTLAVYDKLGKHVKNFTTKRPGRIEVTGYYVGSPFFNTGWAWVSETSKGTFELTGLSKEGMQHQGKDTDFGKLLQETDIELHVTEWLNDKDLVELWNMSEKEEAVAMVIMNTPIKSTPAPPEKEGPQLSYNYPDWFKELKTKIETLLAEEKTTNKDNPHIPDKIFFYASDKVQAQKGSDAWTIEVEKGKREAYLTINKAQWDAAEDKDAYAQQTLKHLYAKVQLMVDEATLTKEEQKEINQIDGTGATKKGSKWGWAVTLKNAIDKILAEQKKTAAGATGFPDKLSLNIMESEGSEAVHLRVWVYREKKDAQPNDLPQLSGGTLPVALKQTDKAEDWAPVVRKAAAAIRTGNVTTDPNAKGNEQGQEGGDPSVLPPYPAHIHPFDMNPDLTTATIASNKFRMIVDTAAVHGTNTLHLTTLHMGMNMYYSWKVYPLPEALKQLKADPNTPQPQYLQSANDYTKKNSTSLGDAKETYDADYDFEQEIDMEDLGEGEFLLLAKTAIGYPEDWNMKRQASIAGLPFAVKKAEDMAKASAMADPEAIRNMKKDAAQETDPKKQALMQDQVKELEAREKTDLLTLTRQDAAETQKLLDKAEGLKKFILDDRKNKIPFAGNKDYDPFMVRLKATDPQGFALYILVRQVFDYRYDDITAIDEYSKLMRQQLDELKKMEVRVGRMTDNSKLRKDLPVQRCVAALVKEDDGNLVPLTLMVGHHEDSDPANGKYKMMVLDVTFDSKKGDMTYVGGTEDSEQAAIHSAFVEFGDDNKYGDGKIVYRVAGTSFSGNVDSDTTFTEYLGYALAAVGIALLIAGSVVSGGLLAPAAAAAVGGVVTALGIGVAVAGAVLAARNIYKRVEKGTFDLDAEFALDVVSIIGAFVQVVGTTGRLMATMSRTMGAVQRTLTIQRLDKLLLIYDAVELGGNAVLVGLKVQDDIQAIKELGLPKEQEDEMMQQVAMEALQQGAMLAYASFSKIKDVGDHLSARIEKSRYQSFRQRGWVDENNKPTDMAPPFMQKAAAEPGKLPNKLQQGDQAKKETLIMEMSVRTTNDQQHKITITERGRIIRCSEFCSDLRMKFSEVLDMDPFLNKEMMELEIKAQAAAKAGNKQEAETVAKAAVHFEAKLKEADDLRIHLFGMSEKEIDDAIEAATSGHVTGGPKSGYKVDDTRIPKRQRRQIDVTDIMTEDELKELGKGGYQKAMQRIHAVMGKKISDIPELHSHWESAKADLLKGKAVTDYDKATVIGMYKDAQRKFWANVRKDPKAVEFLKKHGFEFEGESGAPMAVLGSKGKEATTRGNLTNQERRVSLDHIKEKAQDDNWQRALDADNLELMFQNANSWKEIVQVKFGMREEVTNK